MENIYLGSKLVDFNEFHDMISTYSPKNFFVNVGVSCENFHQTMPEVEGEISLAKKIWVVNSVMLGMGLHSMYKEPISMLSIPISCFREPNEEEVMDDVMIYGDEVLKSKKNKEIFLNERAGFKYDILNDEKISDYEHYDYIGPKRILGHFFVANVFYNDIGGLGDLIRKYDDIPEFDDMTVSQTPEVFFAKDGGIYHQSINSFKNYDIRNFENLINLYMQDEEMLTVVESFSQKKKIGKFHIENTNSDYKFEDLKDLCEEMFFGKF